MPPRSAPSANAPRPQGRGGRGGGGRGGRGGGAGGSGGGASTAGAGGAAPTPAAPTAAAPVPGPPPTGAPPGRGGGPAGHGGRGGSAPSGRGGRGGGPGARGGPGGRGRAYGASLVGMRAGERDANRPSPSIAEHVKAVGVKRREFGTAGRVIKVRMNSFETTVPDDKLYQYDVSTPADMSKPMRIRLMDQLQVDRPTVFTSPVLYDGQAIMFSKQRLKLGPNDTGSEEFNIVIDPPRADGKPPKPFQLKITRVDATINLQVLHDFVAGTYTHDPFVQMAEMALNIALRMYPRKKYPSNARSFFIEDGKVSLGGGLEVRRGFFQSLRPSIGRLLLNVDVSAAVFYRAVPLVTLVLEFLGKSGNQVADLNANRLSDHERRRVERYLHMVKITTSHIAAGQGGKRRPQAIQGVTREGAGAITFQHEKYGKLTVAAYFKRQYNRQLRLPGLPCVKVGKRDVIPMELCDVVPGQFSHNELTPDQTKRMVEFSTMHPPDRFGRIQQGLQMLEHGQSEYVRECGITINPIPIEVDARVLPVPRLSVAPNRTDPRKSAIIPDNGKWNMLNCKYFQPATIKGIMVVIFESERFFNEGHYKEMVKGFVGAAKDFGVGIEDPEPSVAWVTGRPNINDLLMSKGRAYIEEKKKKTGKENNGPSLIIAVLPPNSKELYNDVKRFGYIRMGIATQCLLSNKCRGAKHQYWANIMLKVNVKLGGTNFVPNLSFIDAAKPTIIMGADAIHPPPGAGDKPSFTALVSSVDSNLSKYVASNGIQGGGKEMIKDLTGMVKNALAKWQEHQQAVEKKRGPPLRLFYFRDGVSEGEFQQVLDKELKSIQDACTAMKCKPKITIVIVVKRHHHRAMAVDPKDADPKSFNLPAGSTIDTGVVHPVESDYLQYTHGGLLGTSRPGRYTILYDENDMTADAIQALTFGLAHTFARSTRSVSIPAPVYYAHIVCEKRAIHFDPTHNVGSDAASQVSGAASTTLQAYRDAWMPMHNAQSGVMYWM